MASNMTWSKCRTGAVAAPQSIRTMRTPYRSHPPEPLASHEAMLRNNAYPCLSEDPLNHRSILAQLLKPFWLLTTHGRYKYSYRPIERYF